MFLSQNGTTKIVIHLIFKILFCNFLSIYYFETAIWTDYLILENTSKMGIYVIAWPNEVIIMFGVSFEMPKPSLCNPSDISSIYWYNSYGQCFQSDKYASNTMGNIQTGVKGNDKDSQLVSYYLNENGDIYKYIANLKNFTGDLINISGNLANLINCSSYPQGFALQHDNKEYLLVVNLVEGNVYGMREDNVGVWKTLDFLINQTNNYGSPPFHSIYASSGTILTF